MKRRNTVMFGIMAALFFAAGCAGGKDTDVTENSDTEDVPVVEQRYAEEEAYPELADFLADYWRIPREERRETRYYYNYVDLDEDGTQEIFAIVIREDSLGDDGGPALILMPESDGTFAVIEDFTEMITPVTVSEEMTNGWHDLIYPANDMLERGFLVCRYDPQAGYQSEHNEFVAEMPPVSGVKILSNNLIDDLDQGNYMTLKN